MQQRSVLREVHSSIHRLQQPGDSGCHNIHARCTWQSGQHEKQQWTDSCALTCTTNCAKYIPVSLRRLADLQKRESIFTSASTAVQLHSCLLCNMRKKTTVQGAEKARRHCFVPDCNTHQQRRCTQQRPRRHTKVASVTSSAARHSDAMPQFMSAKCSFRKKAELLICAMAC